jgi:DnaK suppressor protein
MSNAGDTIEDLKQRLREELRELKELSAEAQDAADIVKLDQTKVGRLSRVDALQKQAMSQETARRRLAAIKSTNEALQRIERGEYGRCTDCGDSINPQRLQHDPAVALCIVCAQRREDA